MFKGNPGSRKEPAGTDFFRKENYGRIGKLVVCSSISKRNAKDSSSQSDQQREKGTESGNSEMSYTIGGTWKCRLYKIATGKF